MFGLIINSNNGYIKEANSTEDIGGKSDSSGGRISPLRNPFSRNTVKPFIPEKEVCEKNSQKHF